MVEHMCPIARPSQPCTIAYLQASAVHWVRPKYAYQCSNERMCRCVTVSLSFSIFRACSRSCTVHTWNPALLYGSTYEWKSGGTKKGTKGVAWRIHVFRGYRPNRHVANHAFSVCARARPRYERFSARKNCVRKPRGKLNLHLLIRSTLLKRKLISVTLFLIYKRNIHIHIYIYIYTERIKRK